MVEGEESMPKRSEIWNVRYGSLSSLNDVRDELGELYVFVVVGGGMSMRRGRGDIKCIVADKELE